MTTTERIKLLLELGEADQGRNWPDYLQYGFVETDVPALLDLDAKEAIDDIRLFFAKDCVDTTCAGDLEEVEIELGFRSKRSTPKPDYAQLYGLESLQVPEKPQSDLVWNRQSLGAADCCRCRPDRRLYSGYQTVCDGSRLCTTRNHG